MDTTQIIMLVLFLYCLWMGFREEKTKKRLNLFYEKAITLEIFIQQSDRNNETLADVSLMMLEELKAFSFCKKTERIINDVEAFWKSMFLHLYKVTK